jgi:hypothetical protein
MTAQADWAAADPAEADALDRVARGFGEADSTPVAHF